MENIKRTLFFLLLIPLFIFADDDDDDKGRKTSTLKQESRNISFSVNENNQISLNGSDFVKLTINSNKKSGYKVFVTASKSKLVSASNKQSINYTIKCNAFITQPGGFVVPETNKITLEPNKEVLVYQVRKPANDTIMAEPTCDLIPDPNQNLNALLSNTYLDDITFSIK